MISCDGRRDLWAAGKAGMTNLPSLKQLEYFLVLAETGNFRRTAEKCGISQPSLSVQLSGLEKRLGSMLVERKRGHAILTPAGREAEVRARAVLSAARDLVDWFDAPGRGLAGTIRFGASTTLGPYRLPYVIGQLHAENPGLGLFVEEAPPNVLADGLMQGAHDMILVQLPLIGADVRTLRLFREPLELIVARDHPFAGRACVAATELADATVLTLGPGYALRKQTEDICERLGCQLRSDYQGSSLDALRLMVGMGMGVAFLPALYVRSEIGAGQGDVQVIKLEGPRLLRSIGLVTRASDANGEATLRIAALIQSVARNLFNGSLVMEHSVEPAQRER